MALSMKEFYDKNKNVENVKNVSDGWHIPGFIRSSKGIDCNGCFINPESLLEIKTAR